MEKIKKQFIFVSQVRELITVVDAYGHILNFVQRGITKLTEHERSALVNKGILSGCVGYPELPKDCEIIVEDKEIQGRPVLNFNRKRFLGY